MADIFSHANIAKAVHDSLDQATAAIPEGKRSALLLDATTDGTHVKARLLYAVKVGEGWQFGTAVGYDGHAVDGKVSLLKSWP